MSLMTQSEERGWRLSTLCDTSKQSRRFRVQFLGHSICLDAFAMAVGGPTYIRTCWESIRELRERGHILKDLGGDVGSFARKTMVSMIRDESAQDSSIAFYLLDLVNILAENHPCTGKLVLQGVTFPQIFAMYVKDCALTKDTPIVASESAVRKVWMSVLEKHSISLQHGVTLGKCEICIQLKTAALKVRLSKTCTFAITHFVNLIRQLDPSVFLSQATSFVTESMFECADKVITADGTQHDINLTIYSP
jgi:hypothetical protein